MSMMMMINSVRAKFFEKKRRTLGILLHFAFEAIYLSVLPYCSCCCCYSCCYTLTVFCQRWCILKRRRVTIAVVFRFCIKRFSFLFLYPLLFCRFADKFQFKTPPTCVACVANSTRLCSCRWMGSIKLGF